MKTINYTQTLFYYDGPQVFEAQDSIGGHYVAAAVELSDEQYGYLVKGVNPQMANKFHIGTIDLRTLLLDVEGLPWYLTNADPDINSPIELIRQSDELHKSEFLPEEGFVLHEFPTDDFVVNEARARRNFVAVITTELLKNSGTQHRIPMDVYKRLIGKIENLVKYAHIAVLKANAREDEYDKKSHMMDVTVPALAGSFRFVLEPSKNQSDIFGHSELSNVWQRVDELFGDIVNYSNDADKIRMDKHRGHLAKSGLNLLKLLASQKIDIAYSWANQNSSSPTTFSISASDAKSFAKSLSKIDDIGIEKITLVGQLDKCDRTSGSWRLLTDDGKVTGTIKKMGQS